MKTFRFEFSKRAQKLFAKLPIDIQKRIFGKLSEYESLENPLAQSVKMQNTQNRYRFRIGDYRVICGQKKTGAIIVLLVLNVGHRKDVYDT